MDSATWDALQRDRVVDITTLGAKTAEPRRIEIWMHALGDTFIITGNPGTRDWYANLLANPEFTVHLKQSAKADLRARAEPVTDPMEREQLLRHAPALEPYVTDSNIGDWIARSPLVRVGFV